MKKYIYAFALLISASLFTNCTESDDEFFASTIVTANDLIEIDVIGNEVNVSCNVSRLLPQPNNPFDIYLTSTSRKLFFNYSLQKRNSNGVWESVTPDVYNVTVGEILVDDYISGIAVLNNTNDTYEYESEITLIAGEYRILVTPEIISLDSQEAVMVTIKTSTLGIPSNALEFTVN